MITDRGLKIKKKIESQFEPEVWHSYMLTSVKFDGTTLSYQRTEEMWRTLPDAVPAADVNGETEHRTTQTFTPPRRFNDGSIDKPVGIPNPRAFVAAIVVSQNFVRIVGCYCK